MGQSAKDTIKSIIEGVYEAPKPVAYVPNGSSYRPCYLGRIIQKNLRMIVDADNVFVDEQGIAHIQFKTPEDAEGRRMGRANNVRSVLRSMTQKSPELKGSDLSTRDIETSVDKEDPDFGVIAFFKKF